MGYYTNFKISFPAFEDDEQNEFFLFQLQRRTGIHFDDESTVKTAVFSVDGVKWYSHVDDMKRLSLKHPDILFVVDGDGEENGDVWRAYFRNGKSYQDSAEIAFPEFDESKLE